MTPEEILELVTKITEINDTSAFMNDENLDLALAYVVKLAVNPDIPYATAMRLIVQLQALSNIFSIKRRALMTISDDRSAESSKRKNVYSTVADDLDKLVAALKYYAK